MEKRAQSLIKMWSRREPLDSWSGPSDRASASKLEALSSNPIIAKTIKNNNNRREPLPH
jgi:hypothetical protein